MPASGGAAIQVTKRGGSMPLESVDGQYLYYVKLSQNALWKLPLAGGEEFQVLPAVAGFGSAYAPGKDGIYFIRPPAKEVDKSWRFCALPPAKLHRSQRSSLGGSWACAFTR